MQYFGKTDIGPVRKTNQDAFFTVEPKDGVLVCAVFDGMGGAAAGNVASNMASSTIREHIISSIPDELDGFDFYGLLRSAVFRAADMISAASAENAEYSGMGTTAVIALCFCDKVYIANVGDSRCYHFADGELEQITKDHSFVQMLVDSGEITEDEAEHHPRKNIITKALCGNTDCAPDLFAAPAKGKLLLCSDGLSNAVSNDTIAHILSKGTAKDNAEALVENAIGAFGTDNITAVCIDFEA